MVAAAVLVVLAVAAWASGRIPEHLVALGFFVLAILLQVAPPAVVLSGFTSSALWLIFGGQVMGVAIRHTGLAERIAGVAAAWIGARSYRSVVAGMVALGTVLSFFMPSAMGRVVLLMPIAAALADRYGYAGGPGRTGLLLAAAFGTGVPAFAILPANVPNAVLAGAADAQFGLTLGYLEYLMLHFPVLGLARGGVLALLIPALFPERAPPRQAAARRLEPMSPRERAVAALLAAALVLWATDALHGIPAAWVSLAVGLVMLVPQARLVPPRAINEQISYASLFFVAGVMGVGAVMAHTGLGRLLAGGAAALLPFAPGRPALDFAALAALGAALSLLTTAPGLSAVMTPLAGSLAAATGLPVRTVLMAETLGFANNLLPYQSPPLVVAGQLTGLPARHAAGLSLALFAATTALLLPLDYLWWRLLGWL